MHFRPEHCLFLGYSSYHKGYLCENAHGRIYIARNVIFNEDHYPGVLSPSTSHQVHSTPIIVPTATFNTSSVFSHTNTTYPTSVSTHGTETTHLPPITQPDPIPMPQQLLPTPHILAPNHEPVLNQSSTITPPATTTAAPTLDDPNIEAPSTIPPTRLPIPNIDPNTTSIPINSLVSGTIQQIDTQHFIGGSSEAPSSRTHKMQTRSQNIIFKPKSYLATKHPLPQSLLPSEPRNLKEALQNPKWLASMNFEIGALKSAGTWTFVPCEPGTSLIILLVYVDNIVVTRPSLSLINKLTNDLNKQFLLKDLGDVHYFLGVKIYRDSSSMYLSQTKYITDLLKKLNMEGAKCSPNPSSIATKLSLTEGGNLISWSAKKQQIVARSSTESEFRALANTTTELKWIQSVLSKL
uniref:Reverse transcriptase Ty1/copia-type domain-containing protein n=1 Tax=Cannabis sativa TaxID=3483 RepID=A0A803P3H6_CANSA